MEASLHGGIIDTRRHRHRRPCGPALHWANFANETFCDKVPGKEALTAGGYSGAYTKNPATQKEKNHGCC